MEQTRDRPSAQPAVGKNESPEQALAHLFRLPVEEQCAVLRTVIPRVLGRLQEIGREGFLADLRSAPRADVRLSAPAAPGGPVEGWQQVATDILGLPFAAQQRVVHQAAPRVAAALDTGDRNQFIQQIDEELRQVEAGEPMPSAPL